MADPADTGEPAAAAVAVRAPEGAEPGALAATSTSLVVTLISYDRSTGLATFRTPDGLTRRTVVPPNLRTFARVRGPGRAGAGDDDRSARGLGFRGAGDLRQLTRPGADPPPGRGGPPAGSPASGARRSRAAPARPAPRSRCRSARPGGSRGRPPASAGPSDASARTGAIGKSDTRVPAARSSSKAGRAEEAEVARRRSAPPVAPDDLTSAFIAARWWSMRPPRKPSPMKSGAATE